MLMKQIKTLFTPIRCTVILVSMIIGIWSGESFISFAWREEIEKGVSKEILYLLYYVLFYIIKIYLTTFLIFVNKYNIRALIKFFIS